MSSSLGIPVAGALLVVVELVVVLALLPEGNGGGLPATLGEVAGVCAPALQIAKIPIQMVVKDGRSFIVRAFC
jgi:hypothetical protein